MQSSMYDIDDYAEDCGISTAFNYAIDLLHCQLSPKICALQMCMMVVLTMMAMKIKDSYDKQADV